MAITRRQRQVYDFISEFVQKNGYSPSFEEIGEGLELSSLATVHKHISNLEKKGLLTRDYNRSRSIDLLPPKGRLKQAMSVNTTMVLPLLGRIAAGQPIEAVREPGDHFARRLRALQRSVRARSPWRVHAGRAHSRWRLRSGREIEDRPQRRHRRRAGDGTDATLKRFYREGDNVRLQPSNAAMKPIIVPAASVEIQGRVIGVLRKY